MSTEKKIASNRRNAQKSTGPKSDTGKAVVSQNARTHGLLSRNLGSGDYRRMMINFSVMATPFTSKDPVRGAVSWLIRPLLRIRADLSLYLHRSEDSTPSEQIESHLSEKYNTPRNLDRVIRCMIACHRRKGAQRWILFKWRQHHI